MRQRHLVDPKVMEVLRYYDASSAALLNQTPTFIDVGCYDPAVPPPGQFAVFNALRQSDLPHGFAIQTAHHYVSRFSPAELRETRAQVVEWLLSGNPAAGKEANVLGGRESLF